MDLDSKKLLILNALLKRGGIQHILDAAAEVLQNPILVADMGLNTVAASTAVGTVDMVWPEFKTDDDEGRSIFREVVRKGDFTRVYGSDEPVIGEYSFSSKRFLAARIRDK